MTAMDGALRKLYFSNHATAHESPRILNRPGRRSMHERFTWRPSPRAAVCMTGKSAHTATDIEQLATLLTNLLPISQGAAAPAPPEVGPPCVTAPRCLQVARWPACIAERLVGVADGQ